MTDPQPLPLGLATMPLAELAATLADLSPDAVGGYDAVEVLRASRRLKSMATALESTWVTDVAVRKAGSVSTVERLELPRNDAVDEIRAALGLSVTSAGKLLSASWDATRRLPELQEAMACGGLDERRRDVFADWTGELSEEHAHAVLDELLPRAVLDAEEQLPAHLLQKEIIKHAMALDPTWFARRFKEAHRRRRVIARMNPDGTADLSVQNLQPHQVAAATGRLDELAWALKRDGDPRPIDHLRADLAVGLLDGTYEGMTDTEIFAAMAATRPGPPDRAAGKELVRWTAPVDATGSSAPAKPNATREADLPMAGVQLRIRMTTLLGLDRAPAELAGWTPADPDHALELMPLMSGAQWRYALTDDDGHLIGSGLIHSRPKGWRPRVKRHKGVVDILVPASLLRDLIVGRLSGIELVHPDQFRAWHPVLTELAFSMRNPKPLPDDSNKRMPGRGLRRAIELDKPRCIGVGCGRSSRRSQIDHRLDHALGGRTVDENLAPGCGRDHDLKTKGGWTLHTWTNRGYRWCTPLGRHYIVWVPPVIERIPPARPDFWIEDHNQRPDPDADIDHEGIPWQISKTWHPGGPQPPPDIDIVYTTPPANADEPPPF